jgi:hypothetical protein
LQKESLDDAIKEERSDIVELLLLDAGFMLKLDVDILKRVIVDKENE